MIIHGAVFAIKYCAFKCLYHDYHAKLPKVPQYLTITADFNFMH